MDGISFNPTAITEFANKTREYKNEVGEKCAEIKNQMGVIKSNWSGKIFEEGAKVDFEKIQNCLETIQASMKSVDQLISDVSDKFNQIKY